MTTRERVQQHLAQLTSLDGARRLLAELNYEVTRQPLSRHGWPEAARKALAEDPQIVAEQNGFHVIYGRLPEKDTLPLTGERHVINALLREHPYALFLFSDEDASHWHFVNVKYDGDGAEKRRVFRRITVGPYERQQGRLRTASERLALLDLAKISRDLFGLSPLAVQQRHDEAFNVEAVTRDFFRDYRQIFEAAEAQITGLPDAEALRLFTQRLFNRLMFIMFLERKGWLAFNGRQDYLLALWHDHLRERRDDPEANFFRDRLTLLFFAGLNTKNEVDLVNIGGDFLQTRIGQVPYLNGGLFEEDELDRTPVHAPDAIFGRALDDLFYGYNFTVTESTPLDVEVAVDPEMLGRIFEELVTGRHESGSYYTPKPVVSFMGREALKGYLETACGEESKEAVAAFVDERDATRLRDPEGVLEALRTVTICDPACGSGAYLVGMLQELLLLRQALFASRRLDDVTVYARKLEIIQNNLYGVDIDPFAVNIARLRLWLSLVVEYEGPKPEPLPNLDFKIEVGDSLTGPDPSGGLQPDLFRQQQVKDYFRLKADFMEAHGGDKRILMPQIEALRKEIQHWAHPQKKGATAGSNGFDWVVEFAEAFATDSSNGGFDMVITNPPYVRHELIRDTKPVLRRIYGTLYSGTADLYVYFFYRALQLLKRGGILCFISSNKWMRAKYGQTLRQYLNTASSVRTIVDFGDLPLFAATTYPSIVVVSKTPASSEHNIRALTVDDIAVIERIAEEVSSRGWLQRQSTLQSESWSLAQPAVSTLMAKLRAGGQPLSDYVGNEFYVGVKTALNAAFIIDEATKQRLLSDDAKSSLLIKPWLRGRDVKRWRLDWSGQYLIALQSSSDTPTPHPWSHANSEDEARSIFQASYPAIYQYMAEYEAQLKARSDQGKYWWELRPCAYYSAFDVPKIVWPDIARNCQFTLDYEGFYPDMTLFAIPLNDLYLLGVLNSKLVFWLLKRTSSSIQNDFIRFKRIYLHQLPIPAADADLRVAIESIVHRLLGLRGQGQETRLLEAELNQLVYRAYGLLPEERQLIESELTASDFQ